MADAGNRDARGRPGVGGCAHVRRADCRALRITECIGIGHSSSSGVISRPSRRASNSRSSAALSISRLASVSSTPNMSRRDIIDLTPSHPFRGLYRSHPIHQGGKFSAGWFDHAGQVGPCPQRQVGHRQAPGWRKLSATATSSRPGDVRPAKSANVQATASAAISPIFHTCRDGHNAAL